MDYFYTAVLAVIRGLAGFLPVSSSGHTELLTQIYPSYLELANNPMLDAFLHLGTLIAVLVVFGKTTVLVAKGYILTIKQLLTGKFKFKKTNEHQRLGLWLIVATLPLVVVIFINDTLISKISGLTALGVTFLVSAGLMFIADHSAEGTYKVSEMTMLQALKTGLFQIAGAVTGISRLGATLTATVNMGFTRKSAVEFSYLLAVPAVIGANLYRISDIIGTGFDTALIPVYLTGLLISAVFAFIAIKLVQFLADRDLLIVFTIYCAVAGIGTLIFSFIR